MTLPASFLVRLPDGRSVAVEEYGRPDGPPVLYFHGWPASRLEAGLLADLPVRLLALDRPGYGGSTAQPGRRLLGWAADVEHVTRRLGIARFHVVGLSGGGPFAAACAYALPEQVLGVALVSPVPPPELVGHRDPGVGHLMRLGRHPRLARRLLALTRPLLRRRIITPSTIVGGGLPDSDRAVLDRATMAGLARVWREGFRRGIMGAMSDAQIYARPWGFDLADVRVPVSVWIGDADTLIPMRMLAPYRAIPGVGWHALAGEGHYSLALKHGAEVLRALVSGLPQAPSPNALPQAGEGFRGQLSSSLSQ